MAGTYIKLYRSLIDHDTLANDNTAFIVFTKLLLKVNWKTGSIRIGRHKLSALTNLPKSTCWDALRRLETDSIVTVRSTGRYSEIHICNWEKYQGGADSFADKPPTANRSKTDTINKNKRTKNNTYTKTEGLVINVLNEVTGRSFRVLPKAAKETIDRFMVEEIRLALKNMMLDPWHRQRIHSMSAKYLLQPDVIDKFLTWKSPSAAAVSSVPRQTIDPSMLTKPRRELAAIEYPNS